MQHILAIDDNQATLDLIEYYLTGSDYTVRLAHHGAEGVTACREHTPDIVIVDIFMPEKDGIETIREITTSCPGTPRILAISGGGEGGSMQYLEYATHFGAHATLPKPFSRDQLLAALGQLSA